MFCTDPPAGCLVEAKITVFDVSARAIALKISIAER
jgi:hypothetical protein